MLILAGKLELVNSLIPKHSYTPSASTLTEVEVSVAEFSVALVSWNTDPKFIGISKIRTKENTQKYVAIPLLI